MSAPYEIVVSPVIVWTAPVGEAFTDVDTTPAGNWLSLGAITGIGSPNTEDGVVLSFGQEGNDIVVDNETGPIKWARTLETLMIAVTCLNTTPLQFTKFLSGTAPTSTAAGGGTPGFDDIGLSRGLTVFERALLIRGTGTSPMDDGSLWSFQYEIPKAVQTGDAELAYVKGQPAGLSFEFKALVDPSASTADEKFGRYVVQDATAV